MSEIKEILVKENYICLYCNLCYRSEQGEDDSRLSLYSYVIGIIRQTSNISLCYHHDMYRKSNDS
jgi:hypothetical protein